jgi:hypothetical protein
VNQIVRNVALAACLFLPAGVGVGSHVAAATGCSPAANQEAKDVTEEVLTASQLACIVASALTDAPALAEACKIDSKLIPALEPFLEQKRAAKRAAACAPDAGK